MYASESPWGSPVHLVTNPEVVLGGDYRALNKQTIPDSYALLHLTDFANDMAGSKFFTSLDLLKSFHQVVVAPEDQQKAVMVTPPRLLCIQKNAHGFMQRFPKFSENDEQPFKRFTLTPFIMLIY